jgi:preprotein translocase subunit SecD
VPPAGSRPRPVRSLAIVLLALIGLYCGVAFGSRHAPALGLDLRGGTSATLTATAAGGGTPSQSALNETVNILRDRINGSGVNAAQVTTEGNNHVIVQVPGTTAQATLVKQLTETAQLRFRLVEDIAPGAPGAGSTSKPGLLSPSSTPTPAPTTTPSAAPTASHKAKPRATRSTSSHGMALSGALLATRGHHSSAKPSATPSASGSASPTASPGTAGTAAGRRHGRVRAVFPPSDLSAAVAAFNKLDCATQPNPTQGTDKASDLILACSPNRATKFLLAPAGVLGSQIASASSDLNTQTNQWEVLLNFNHSGSSAWYNLTAKASSLGTFTGSCSPPTGCNAIAVVLDGVVESYPTVNNGPIAGGNTQITGNFTQAQATNLANILKYGALPLHLSVPTIQTISPTLGSSELRGGLIAGAIGLGLVVLYSLLYYRALGLVTIASLALSGGLLYALVTILGETEGYTLTLAGIAGFIVAVGITADSFVVFFERLRDAIREGRSLRSAVEFAWPRARRTILSADIVSLLAAAVLYWLSIGDVRGFAFTLGLSTLCDLFIVFLFTKPLLSLVVRAGPFSRRGALTGLSAERIGPLSAARSLPRRRSRPPREPAAGEGSRA